MSRVPDSQVLANLDATVRWAAGDGGNVDRLGITGFCWGGRIVWLYAAHQPQLRAAVAWYGRLSGRPDPQQPEHPIDVIGRLHAPVLGLYGGQDKGIPLESVEAVRAAIAATSDRSAIRVYPDAPHAFFADYRPSYRPEAAADAWGRMQRWFRDNGV